MRALFLATIYLVPLAMIFRYVYFWAVYSFRTFFSAPLLLTDVRHQKYRDIIIVINIMTKTRSFLYPSSFCPHPHFLSVLVNGFFFDLRHLTCHLPHVGCTAFVLCSLGAECVRKMCFNRQRANSKLIGSMFQSDWTLMSKFKSAHKMFKHENHFLNRPSSVVGNSNAVDPRAPKYLGDSTL